MRCFLLFPSPPADGPNKPPQTLNQSGFQNITYCVFSALLDTIQDWKEGCSNEIEGLVSTLQGHCHDNKKDGDRGGRKRAQLQREARAQLGFLHPFRVCRMQLPSLSFVNEATDCSFWGSFPKVCHEKEARC